jgi:hypothetical protein
MSANNDGNQQQATPAAGQQQQEPQGGQSGFTPPASQADLDRIIADRLSRERAKFADYDDLRAKAEQLDAIEEANKTEAQKQADALAAAQAKIADYERREQITEWKKEVSEATGVPANVLAGSTKEEIEAHAETLKPLIAAPAPARPEPLIVPAAGRTPPALNSSALEDALRKAVGAK